MPVSPAIRAVQLIVPCVVLAGLVAIPFRLQVQAQDPAMGQPPPPAAAGSEQPPAPATQPTDQPADQQRDQRLKEIEQQLRDLTKQVEALRNPPAATPAPPPTAPSLPQLIVPEAWRKTLTWRSIGPANMGGRIVDLAINPSDPSMFWIATASGGLLKTTNNGITLEHQFDKEATVSIGAVEIAPSDPNIVWVGTGENNPRNSVSFGDGVYKSVDGGKTWKNMGLPKSFQIGRIIVHPRDPNVVYVGALGRLYGPNEERGLFKTSDGGQTWERVLFVDDKTGVIDMRMHPSDPETLIVAMWERLRDEFDSWPGSEVPKPDGYDGYDPIRKYGPASGLYKTTDGGKSWRKLTQGLPTSQLGRIGLDWHRANPNILYAIVDCENIGKGPPPFPAYLGVSGQNVDGAARVAQVQPESPAAKAGIQVGDVLVQFGETVISQFDQLLDQLRERRPGQTVKLQVKRGQEVKDFELTLANRPGTRGGRPAGVWLGVQGEDREGKLVITQVVPEGPAAKAGVQVGDVVATAAGKTLTYEQLIGLVREQRSGDKLAVNVVRGSETKELVITLEDRPGREAPSDLPPSDVYLGIQGEDAAGGALLVSVTEDGPADKAGLQEGDIVEAVEGKPIANYAALTQEIRARKAGDKLRLAVRRADETREFTATLETRPGGASPTRPYSASLGGQAPNAQDQQGTQGFEYGGVYRSDDGGETWIRVNSLHSRPMYFSQIRVDPQDANFVYVLGVAQYRSTNGGVTFDGDFGRGVHADGHALWIDPRDGRHLILGTDGGAYVTYDRGGSWDHLNHVAIGQFYHVAIAPKEPYHVTGGLQDNGTWFGPSLSKHGGGPINEDWISVGGGDGFMCRVDPDDPDLVYFSSQNGAMARRNLRTGEGAAIRPPRPRGAPGYRFNWNTPFLLSHHNSAIFLCAGNYVFRSLQRGDNLEVISPEIPLTKRGSATALAESPRNPQVMYVGTDDGALRVTRDGGRQWTEISQQVGLPGPRWVATIEASRFADGRVYVAFDGHRKNDDEPYVYVSEDFGQTWQSLRANLPWGSTRCLREDLENPNLLFVGTEFAAWCSLDRGKYWNSLNTNLPSVAVHEFAIHPRSGELVAATHGRSLWIGDLAVLRQMTPDVLQNKPTLYEPATVVRWLREPARGRTNRRFVGNNPPPGAQIYYSLPQEAKDVSLQVLDIEGQVVRELRGPKEPGLHRVAWDLLRAAPPPPRSAAEPATGQPPARQTPAARANRPAAAGTYRVVLKVDDQQHSQLVRVVNDPALPPTIAAQESLLGASAEQEPDEEEQRAWIDD